MNLLIDVLMVIGASAVAIAAMLLVRRRAPDGSYLNDGDRAAGVFGVQATGFAVLLGYARSVAGVQWDRMEAGTLGEDLNPWAGEMFRTLQTVDPQTPTELFPAGSG